MSQERFDIPLPHLLRRRADDEPNRLACAFLPGKPDGTTATLSYGELDRTARAIAAHLADLGLEAGDRVLLVYPPGLDFLAAFLGCLYSRILPATAYPPRPGQPLTAIRGILADCAAHRVLSTTGLRDFLAQQVAAGGGGLPVPVAATDRVEPALADAWRDPGMHPDHLAFLQYTSGSTGDPKGVMVSHGNLVSTCTDVHRGFGHTRDSVMVSWLPTFHDMGLIYGVLLPLLVGFPTYLMAPATFLRHPFRWLQAISDLGGTHTSSPDFGYQLCLGKISDEERSRLDLSSWQVAANGAEAVRVRTQEGFLRRFAPCGVSRTLFCPSYGLAEVGLKVATARRGQAMHTVALNAAALERHRLETVADDAEDVITLVACGRTEIGARIEIIEPESGRPCAEDRVGEIWVSSTSVAQGYWGRPQLSEATFQARTADGEGPFLRTGDLGFFHDGRLYVAGRIKDLVIVRGRNHYAHDIEHTVGGVDPALRPGCGAAFGLEVDGSEQLVVVQEVRADALVDPTDLADRIHRAIVSRHGVTPHEVLLVLPGSIPKTSSGKLRRPLCRERYRAGRLQRVVRAVDRESHRTSA